MADKKYIAIDLKSFYASVECVERGMDPLDTNLVVADETRTDKTICLAVTPSLKSIGVPGRARLFEAKQILAEHNAQRRRRAPRMRFSGKSVSAAELSGNPSLESDMIIASPRMAYYMEYSRRIVSIYLRYVSFEDVLVYSIDEVFIDVTNYLDTYKMNAHDFTMMLVRAVLSETGITATAGIGTNMYLAKIAMDIVAKHMPADADGVRIAELDELSYRKKLWCHEPITDFWRIGPGIARRLAENGMYTMGDIAQCSVGYKHERRNEELLYKLFGVNAELIIDHAWGYEPVEIADCKSYQPTAKSKCEGQVLSRPYSFDEGRIVVSEMADNLAMDLVYSGHFTNQVVLDVAYDTGNVSGASASFAGTVVRDRYGRNVPKPVHGSENLGSYTASSNRIMEAVCRIYDRIVDRTLMVRRFSVTVAALKTEDEIREGGESYTQTDLFTDYEEQERVKAEEREREDKELRVQRAVLKLRARYGANFVVRGMNMQDGATAMDRHKQIGGHKA